MLSPEKGSLAWSVKSPRLETRMLTSTSREKRRSTYLWGGGEGVA